MCEKGAKNYWDDERPNLKSGPGANAITGYWQKPFCNFGFQPISTMRSNTGPSVCLDTCVSIPVSAPKQTDLET